MKIEKLLVSLALLAFAFTQHSLAGAAEKTRIFMEFQRHELHSKYTRVTVTFDGNKKGKEALYATHSTLVPGEMGSPHVPLYIEQFKALYGDIMKEGVLDKWRDIAFTGDGCYGKLEFTITVAQKTRHFTVCPNAEKPAHAEERITAWYDLVEAAVKTQLRGY